MKISNKYWTCEYNGKLYRGSLDKDTNAPDGYGVMAYPVVSSCKRDYYGNAIVSQLYVGHFSDGVRDGRGFILTRKEFYKTITRERTYEEVMETAEFDSCGRVIHCEGGPISYNVRDENWIMESDGIWKDDILVKPIERNMSAWEGYHVEVSKSEIAKDGFTFAPSPCTSPVTDVSPDGELKCGYIEIMVSPLDDGLLCCNRTGESFVLKPGETVTVCDGSKDTLVERYDYYTVYEFKLIKD